MKKHNHRLVLECVSLAAAIARLVTEILALVGTAINYLHEYKVVHPIRA